MEEKVGLKVVSQTALPMAAMKIFYKQKHLCFVVTNSDGKGSIIERSIELSYPLF